MVLLGLVQAVVAMNILVLARKPTSSNIVGNVMSFGTAALNIKESRVVNRYPTNVFLLANDETQNCPVRHLEEMTKDLHPPGNRNIDSELGLGNTHFQKKGSYNFSYKGRALRNAHDRDQTNTASKFFKQFHRTSS